VLNEDVSPAVAAAAEQAVLRSFEKRPMRHGITQAEARRRVAICERIWKVLRLEKGWSIQRVCDHFLRFLLDEIDGIPWEPDDRAIWVPDGSLSPGENA
jgi:hypothetical protein